MDSEENCDIHFNKRRKPCTFERNRIVHGFLFMQLAHNCRYVVFLFTFLKWNDMAVDFFSVHKQLCNAFLYVVWILDFDLVLGTAEGAVKGEVAEVFRDTRINAETGEFRLYAEDCLRNVDKRPCGGTGQPAVLCLAEEFCVSSGYHLGVNVRLGAVNLTDVLDISRAGLAIDFKSAVAASDDGLRD